VQPSGESFDSMGRGAEEGISNVSSVEGDVAKSSIDMIRQISSTGYLRKRVPDELVAMQGVGVVETATATISETVTMTGAVMDERTKAKFQGYEGDPCGECGNFTLVRNGTCMKCNTCGGTSGCS